jgi:hypothetical protein
MKLMSDANQHSPQQPPSRTVQLSAFPQQQAAQAKDLHLYAVGGMIIGGIADGKGLLKAPDRTAASVLAEAFLTELIRSVRPRDGVEEMLLIQMAMVHQRIGNLSHQAADQVLTKNVAVINQAVDGACNLFRRQMLALAECRRATSPKHPASAPVHPVEDSRHENRANEQGSKGSATSAPVPTDTGGVGGSARGGAASSAVAMEHGSANGSGQVALKAQRAEARAIQPLAPRQTAANQRRDPAAAARRRRRAP